MIAPGPAEAQPSRWRTASSCGSDVQVTRVIGSLPAHPASPISRGTSAECSLSRREDASAVKGRPPKVDRHIPLRTALTDLLGWNLHCQAVYEELSHVYGGWRQLPLYERCIAA